MRLMPKQTRAFWLKLIPELLRLVAWSMILGCSIVLSITALYMTIRLCWVLVRETHDWL